MKLENERLQVHFAHSTGNQRFDCTAMVTQVIVDGVHKFCTPEQVLLTRRTTQGLGLCGEFVLPGAAEGAQDGQWFHKPGVGSLKQTADHAPYDMWQKYETSPSPVSVESGPDRITFRQAARPALGWGIDIEKTFTLRDNRLILDITATNAGDKPCVLEEYQHNFLSVGGLGVGLGYILDLSCDLDLPRLEQQTLRQGDEAIMPSVLRVADGSAVWTGDMAERIVYHRSECIAPEGPYRWTLRHSQSPARVTEETDFRPSRIDIWSVEHCVCPEFYFHTHLLPGEQTTWRRTWTFSAE